MTTKEIILYIEKRKKEYAENGASVYRCKASDIAYELGLKNRFPMICSAMNQCKNYDDIVVHETPSGQSSTYEIEYKL